MGDYTTRKKNGQMVHHWTSNMDCFATPVPSFNFEGRGKVGSRCGMFTTFLFMAAMIYYSLTGFGYMIMMHNPLLSTVVYRDFYDSSEDTFNLADMQT